MPIRKIIHIDEEKCNGCGQCVPACAEGAIQIINGKAKLVADKLCDGLGACLGNCPQGALQIIEREAEEFDEEAVKERHAAQKQPDHQPAFPLLSEGCPGSRVVGLESKNEVAGTTIQAEDIELRIKPQLTHWPVQLRLVPVDAPYLYRADLLVCADCVPFAYPNFQLDLLKGKKVVVGCPKLDDLNFYIGKLTAMVKVNNFNSITVAFMEVPCCLGIVKAVQMALQEAGKKVDLKQVKIGIQGDKTVIC